MASFTGLRSCREGTKLPKSKQGNERANHRIVRQCLHTFVTVSVNWWCICFGDDLKTRSRILGCFYFNNLSV